MITEDFVSLEIARLLKEKGFDENCAALYHLRTGEIIQQGVGYVFNNSQWENFIREIKTDDFETLYDYTSEELNSPEKATEVAIKYCLENLI